MNTLSDLRREMAGDFRTTDDNLREKMKPLHAVMKAAARSGEGFRQGQAAPATAQNAAFLALAAMLPGSPKTIAARVQKLWTAHFEPKGQTCPVTKATTLGDAFVVLIEDAAARAKLQMMQIAYDYEVVSFTWNDDRVSVFHPHSDREYQERVEEAKADRAGFTRVGQLGPNTFAKIAALTDDNAAAT